MLKKSYYFYVYSNSYTRICTGPVKLSLCQTIFPGLIITRREFLMN